jgi:hypothetical protein
VLSGWDGAQHGARHGAQHGARHGARHSYSGLPRRLIAAGTRRERRFASVIQSDAIGVAKVVFVAQL